ncbi:MAG: flagellar biosynthetic protein FliQ [Phycisphaerae bacterium]|nr:flagellar biosynthetic protein FliQ [Phycisphaerae bacterium]
MDNNFVIYLGRQTLEISLLISAPILLTCIVVGVVITLFQAVTSIRDMSLTVAPKLVAVGFVTLFFGSWMLGMLLKFTNEIFGYIQSIGR